MRRTRRRSGSQLVMVVFSLLMVISMVLALVAGFFRGGDGEPTPAPTSVPALSQARSLLPERGE